MPQTNADAEIRALQAVIEALEPLDDEARSRVLDYTLKRLGMRDLSLSSLSGHAPEASPQTELKAPKPAQLTDIRTLREAKQPSSAVEMAAVVAYYLAEAAPADERKEAVTTADLEKYFKQANYRLPTRIATTLNNAAAAGYFDRTARGAYRLNPVGFNLVTQTCLVAPGRHLDGLQYARELRPLHRNRRRPPKIARSNAPLCPTIVGTLCSTR